MPIVGVTTRNHAAKIRGKEFVLIHLIDYFNHVFGNARRR